MPPDPGTRDIPLHTAKHLMVKNAEFKCFMETKEPGFFGKHAKRASIPEVLLNSKLTRQETEGRLV